MSAQYHNGHWYGGGQDIDIQSDPQATSLNAGEVPTGDTIESVLNTNFVKKAWTAIGAYTGTNINATIPSGAKEIHVRIFFEGSSGNYLGHVFDFIVEELTDSAVGYTAGGYYNSSDFSTCTILINKTSISNAYATFKGASKTPYTSIYWR